MRSLLHRSLGQKGVGLLEVSIAGAILGILVLAFMRINEQMVNAERRMFELMETQDLAQNIRYQMANALACSHTFEKEYPDGKLPLKGELTSLVDQNKKPVASVGEVYGPVLVERISFEADAEAARLLGALPTTHILKGSIAFKGQRSKGFRKIISFTVPVLGSFNAAEGKIDFEYCDSLTSPFASEVVALSMRKLCDGFGAQYDPRSGTCDLASQMMEMMTSPGVLDLSNILKQALPQR